MKHTVELARIFKALSDPNRLEIFLLLRNCCPAGCRPAEANEGNTVSNVAAHFDLSLSTVSHHIKELRMAGLIVCEKRGQTVYCGPNEAVLDEIENFLKTARGSE
jgi:ArsR family transcriptional regulator